MFHEEENEDDVLSIIKKLMEELAGNMEYSSDDFEERLGRKKPEMEVSIVKGEMPEHEMEEMADVAGMEGMEDDDDEGDELKDRLMRLRKG